MGLKRLIAKGLRRVLQPAAITGSRLHKKARVCSGTQVNYSTIDRYSYVGHGGFLLSVDIGPFCSVADNCRIGGAEHPISFVSTSPVFHSGKNVFGCNFSDHPVAEPQRTTIGADVWIGANVIVKSGVTIGTGAVVGAGSVVTHDVPSYEIWAGNPARKIRDRFDKKTAEALEHSQWWTLSEEELFEKAKLFDNPAVFIGDIEKK